MAQSPASHINGERNAVSRPAIRWCTATGLALGVQAYVLYYFFHYGALAGLLQWDDCAIFLRGLQNLDRLAPATTLLGLIHSGLHLDIHAPLSDIQTMAGILISGGSTWGPYLFSATWLALVLEAILAAASCPPRAGKTSVVLCLFVLVQALTLGALSHIKSDWAGGLLLAGALPLLTWGAETGREDLRMRGTMLLSLAILSKLTAFYLPFVAVLILLLFEGYGALVQDRHQLAGRPGRAAGATSGFRAALRSIDLRRLALRIAIVTAPFVLCFLDTRHTTLAYIRFAMGATWSDGLTAAGRAWFYSPWGIKNPPGWGNLHYSLLVFVTAALLLAWRRRERAYPLALLLHVVIAAMLFLPLILADSNSTYEATFLGVLIAAALISMDYLIRSLPHSGVLAVGAAATLIALPAVLPFKYTGFPQFPVSPTERRHLEDVYMHIVDTMVSQARREAPHIVVFYDHVYAPHPNIAIQYFRRTGQFVPVDRVDDLLDTDQIKSLSDADFVLTLVPRPDRPGESVLPLYPAYPISRDPGSAENVVSATGRSELIGTFSIPGGEIHLYSMRAPQDGGTHASLVDRPDSRTQPSLRLEHQLAREEPLGMTARRSTLYAPDAHQ